MRRATATVASATDGQHLPTLHVRVLSSHAGAAHRNACPAARLVPRHRTDSPSDGKVTDLRPPPWPPSSLICSFLEPQYFVRDARPHESCLPLLASLRCWLKSLVGAIVFEVPARFELRVYPG